MDKERYHMYADTHKEARLLRGDTFSHGYLLVIPSVMMSVILQQEDNILMLSWSTISAWQQKTRCL